MFYRRLALFLIFLIFGATVSFAGKPAPNWKKWDRYPDVPRIDAKYVQHLFRSGEKMTFIYAGYKVKSVVSGSVFIPYTSVPPYADGSEINLKVPKDHWMVAYCP